MHAIGKIGTPLILIVACIFAIGGATALQAGSGAESAIYFLLSFLVAALALILLRERHADSGEKNRHTGRNSGRYDDLRHQLRRRLPHG